MAPFQYCCASAAAFAQSYPSKPVRVILPYPPGGSSDPLVRAMAQRLSDAFKINFVVDNRPGANGIIGVEYVAKGPADGYRLLFTYAASMVVNPSLYRKLPYDPLRDFAPIAQIGRGGNLLLNVSPRADGSLPPEQVETGITGRFERFFTLASSVDHIESRSLPGVSLIKVYFQPGTNADSAVTTVSNLAMAQLRHAYGIPPQHAMPTTWVTLQSWGAALPVVSTGQLLSTLTAIGVTIWVWRRPGTDVTLRNILTGALVLMATPYGFVYDATLLTVAIAIPTGSGLTAQMTARCINSSWLPA